MPTSQKRKICYNVDLTFKPVYTKIVMRPSYTELSVLDLVPFGLSDTKSKFFALRLSNPGWTEWRPGQFVMLRPESFGLELPWGRPFSICHMTSQHLVCFFKIAGPGTEKMAALKRGAKIGAWGPLGNFFAVEEQVPTLLLAGGMGIAPFVGYVYRHPKPWNLSMLFGHREPCGCYPIDNINERITVDCLRETQDGDLDNFIYTMQEKIVDCAEQNGLVLACGPLPFLKCVQDLSKKASARTQISLEPKMACGVGACLGCSCRTSKTWPIPESRESYVQVCAQGPVFWADQVVI